MHIDGVMMYDRSDFVVKYPEKKLISARTNAHMSDVTWDCDMVVHIPRGTRVVAPIQLQTMVDSRLNAQRVTIIIEDDAHVTIHDMTSMSSFDQMTRSIEVIVGDYAQVIFVTHQDRPVSVNEVSRIRFYLGNYSSLQYASLITGSNSSTSWLDVIMQGEYAQAELNGVWLLDGVRTIDMTTMQQHLGAHNTSRLRIKSAVRDRARSIYRGTVHIAVDACGTHAAQENKNILLSEHASAYSIPNLEALNNDVYCAHGTAVGQLDAEQLLYMQARGIAHKQAQRMLLQGFLADAMPQFLDGDMHLAFMARIAQWLDE
jgi:Fe-S cluster assembly protein SufD